MTDKEVKEQYTERSVRDMLIEMHYATNDVAFNLVGIGPYNHEMDFVKISDRGYVEEYEIKISKADILAESKKVDKYDNLLHGCCTRHTGVTHPFQVGSPFLKSYGRSSYLSYKCIRISVPIKKIWIAVPTKDLAEYALEHTQPWVGVVEVTAHGLSVSRKAEQIKHCRPLTSDERCHILRRVALRYWHAYRGLHMPSGRGGKTIICSDEDKN